MTDTQLSKLKRDKNGKFAGGIPPAGFNVHPENQSPGGWRPEYTFSYQYKRFMNMEVEKFKNWKDKNPDRTMVEEIAWNAVLKARGEYKYLQEVSNRAEGMPKQEVGVQASFKVVRDEIPIDAGNTNQHFLPDETTPESKNNP
jgi:hypothetical protein